MTKKEIEELLAIIAALRAVQLDIESGSLSEAAVEIPKIIARLSKLISK